MTLLVKLHCVYFYFICHSKISKRNPQLCIMFEDSEVRVHDIYVYVIWANDLINEVKFLDEVMHLQKLHKCEWLRRNY